MKNLTFYDLLSSSLLKTEQVQLISIMDREPLLAVWLQEGGFKKYHKDLKYDFNQTSLLSYALTALDLPQDILSKELKEKKYLAQAVKRFEALRKSQNPIDGFKEAGLIALALYERWIKMNTWSGLCSEISIQNNDTHFLALQNWQTTLSILYCASGYDMDLLHTILEEVEVSWAAELIFQMIITQFIPLEKKVEWISQLYADTNMAGKLNWLQLLSVKSPLIGKLIVEEHKAPSEYNAQKKLQGIQDIQSGQEILVEALLKAYRFLLLDSKNQAKQYFDLAGQITKKLMVNVEMLRLGTSEHYDLPFIWKGQEKVGSSEYFEDVVSSNSFKIQNLDEYKKHQGIIYRLETINEIALSGETARAVELAKIEFADWLNDLLNRGIDFESSVFLLNFNHAYLVSLLEKLGLFDLVDQYLLVLDQLIGSHSFIQDFIVTYYEDQQNQEKIYLNTKKSLIIQPNQREKHQNLITLLSQGQFWPSALAEWQLYSEMFELNEENWIEFAKTACKANNLVKANAILKTLLEADYEGSKLFGLKGQIAYLEGSYVEAKKHLKDAVKYFPEQAESWIYLSNVYEREGDVENALSSLKSGIFASPDHADLYFNLAQLYLNTQSYSEALKHLRKAVVLNRFNPELYYPLISTLQTVGLWDEAWEYLSFARKEWPSERKFAYLDAKRFLEEGQKKEAIDILKIATEGEPEQVPSEWYLLLVETILNQDSYTWLLADDYEIDMGQLLISQKTLQNLLVQNEQKNATVVQVLLAEIYYLLEEYDRSKKIFEQLFSENKSNLHQTEFGWRVYAGLGVIRCHYFQYEEALVLVAQASKLNPSDLAIKRKLADIYYLANLPEEALKIATEIVNHRRDDLKSILWFADFAKKINRPVERIDALEQAIQFAKNDSRINNQLAVEYILQGREEEAVQVLEGLLQNQEASFNDFRTAVTALLRIDKVNEALTFYQEGLNRSTCKMTLESQTELIYLYFLNEKWEEVLKVITSENFEGCDYMAYHTIQAYAFQYLNQADASITSFKQALDLGNGLGARLFPESKSLVFIPENWIIEFENREMINRELVTLWVSEKEFDKAILILENLITAAPTQGINYFLVIELLVRTNNYEGALLKLKALKKNQALLEDLKELAFAYEIFLASMLNQQIPEIEYIKNQDFILSQAITAFVYLHQHQVSAGLDFFQIAFDHAKETQLTIEDATPLGAEQCTTAIFYRLLLMSANQINNYSALDFLFERMKLSAIYENELPFYQIILNLSYRGFEWLFNKLDVEYDQSSIHYPLSGANALEVSLLPVVEKISNHRQRQKLERIFSGFEAKTTQELENLYSENIPELGGGIILELLKREEIALVDKLLIRQPNFMGALIYAAAITEEYPLEAKLVLDRLPDFEDPVFLYLKGLINYNNQLIDVAIVDIRKALSLWAGQLNWKLNLAGLLTEAEHVEEACKIWQELLTESTVSKDTILIPYLNLLVDSNQITESERILTKFYQVLAEKFETYFLMVKIYYKSGNYEKALDACKRAEHFEKDNPDLSFWKAKIYYKLGQFEESAQFAKSFVNIHPDHLEATKLLITANKKAGRLDDTIRLIDLALVHMPVDLDFQLEKLDVLVNMERYNEAAKYSGELKETFYDQPEFNAKVADLYLRMGDFHAAEHAAKAAIRHSEGGYPELRIMLAKILVDQGHYDQALHYLGEAAAMEKGNALPCFEMGKIYHRMKDFQQALVSYQEAIKRDGSEPQAYYEAGLIMREIKDYQGAEKMLRIASELNPKDTNIRRQLAGVVALNFVHAPAEVK